MRLKNLIKELNIISIKNFKNYNIKSVTHLSQDVVKNSMFICIEGNNFDGNSYAEFAIKNGAKCIITCKDLDYQNATIIRVENVRIAMSILAKNFYNRCSDNLDIVGIIGTSGKTTTSIIVASLLKEVDNNVGIIGTNGIYIGNIKMDNKFTTPDPLELHYILFQMHQLNVKKVIMEVSAQAISLYKMYGIKLKVGVFTNISQEHLDFFGSMENYARCKMDYFNEKNMQECVINIDDFYGRELAYKVNIPCVSYGVLEPANSFAIDINYDINGTNFFANICDKIFECNTKFVGQFNVYNLLASLTVVTLLGMNENDIKKALKNLKMIDGRFNVFRIKNKTIIVDFAHTPDAFEKTLSFIKNFVKKKLITIFGCVGYSDYDKRVQMGAVADKYSDEIILTTDNRGDTSFQEIVNDISVGIKNSQLKIIEDRESAILSGFDNSSDGDIICVLGKGAENFQTINKNRVPYSDLEVVKKIIKDNSYESCNS